MSNIFNLTGKTDAAPPVGEQPPAAPVVNTILVGVLEQMLERAKSGELVSMFSVGLVTLPGTEDPGFYLEVQTGTLHPYMLLGAVTDAQARFAKQIPAMLEAGKL